MQRLFSAFLMTVFCVVLTAAGRADTLPGFEDLAEKLSPTVVNISTTSKIESPQRPLMPEMPQIPEGSPFEQFFKDFYDQYKNTQPQGEEKVSSLGSGFIIDAQKGYIVTNNHVIRDADEIKVILHDDTSLDAKLIGTDEKTDIAVLQVETKKPLTAAIWGDSDTAKVGSWVLAIGNPFGLGGTVTAGIVSARQRNINAGPYDDFIQTDASINRGNSGGPMFNTKGEVVGVNTAIFSPSGGSVGIGFSVPSNLAHKVVEQLIKYGQTKRGWLGVRIQEVTPEMIETLGLDKEKGALVSSAIENSPGAKAGIKAGDVILKFDGQDIDQMRKLPRLVADTEVGKVVEVEILRNKKKITVSVTLAQLEKAEESGDIQDNKPANKDKKTAQKGSEIAELGLTVKQIDAAERGAYGLKNDQKGVVITAVKQGSGADEKGIVAGDIVIEVEQKEIVTIDDFNAQIAAAKSAGRKTVLLFLERKNDRRFVALSFAKK